MTIFLLAIILVLICALCFQFQKYKARTVNLTLIHNKLQQITTEHSNEKLLVFTGDRALIPLLIEINQLLDHHHKVLADYAKTERSMKKMISNVSHDLKTPLTVVLGYLEMMMIDKKMSAEETTALHSKVYQKTIEVLELIEQFFDLAKLEAGDQELEITKVHMNEICRQNILAFYDVLTVKGFNVHIEIPDEPVFARGNEETLNRIFNNLIANAILHGGEGKTVGLTLKSDEHAVYVDIWDKGKGIAALYQDEVFERMYTLEDSRNKASQGSGLGLTITKRLVETLGGTIHLSSQPYVKTSFSLTLKRMDHSF
ncbi:sensor histidine kinase [Bacillus chungangensis]|uniref:histidine kinase n=1 Tax=Bacillus chungangensis TaxID=587633 RepID=A0ABT9WU42_9BACI|nr:sensor histidine kinase [Bacillus chungangensis]MDQ0176812.1 signal transduction histidine kinase [Bacillus chungangensis]